MMNNAESLDSEARRLQTQTKQFSMVNTGRVAVILDQSLRESIAGLCAPIAVMATACQDQPHGARPHAYRAASDIHEAAARTVPRHPYPGPRPTCRRPRGRDSYPRHRDSVLRPRSGVLLGCKSCAADLARLLDGSPACGGVTPDSYEVCGKTLLGTKDNSTPLIWPTTNRFELERNRRCALRI